MTDAPAQSNRTSKAKSALAAGFWGILGVANLTTTMFFGKEAVDRISLALDQFGPQRFPADLWDYNQIKPIGHPLAGLREIGLPVKIPTQTLQETWTTESGKVIAHQTMVNDGLGCTDLIGEAARNTLWMNGISQNISLIVPKGQQALFSIKPHVVSTFIEASKEVGTHNLLDGLGYAGAGLLYGAVTLACAYFTGKAAIKFLEASEPSEPKAKAAKASNSNKPEI
ncbi:MAG: hypothetical protein PHE27_03740 [Alphaproteobacteria bacterium]|nr:hypothetical protein [Alphaproteobacteria bacterium]